MKLPDEFTIHKARREFRRRWAEAKKPRSVHSIGGRFDVMHEAALAAFGVRYCSEWLPYCGEIEDNLNLYGHDLLGIPTKTILAYSTLLGLEPSWLRLGGEPRMVGNT